MRFHMPFGKITTLAISLAILKNTVWSWQTGTQTDAETDIDCDNTQQHVWAQQNGSQGNICPFKHSGKSDKIK